MTSVALTTRPPAELAVDTLVVGSVQTPDGADLATGHHLPRKAVVHLQAVLSDVEATGKADEVVRVVAVPGVKATSVVVTGLGDGSSRRSTYPHAALRSAAGAALRSVRGKRSVAVALPTPDLASLSAVADGAYAGCYAYDKSAPLGARRGTGLRSNAKAATTNGAGPRVLVVSGAGQGKAAKDAVTRAAVLGAARDWARDLVNLPPNVLFPQSFADNVKKRVAASAAKVTVSVLDDKALVKGGFGGIVGVGQGSANPPRIVTMSYAPAAPNASVALVGKGITFDSGGLNIKPATGMVTMKCDMAGAAAVAATVLAAAELGLPVAVTGYLCLAENMPSGTAQRPSDVVVMRNGTSVEILDTDAEGRMVLGDGLCLASEKHPDWVVDIATLTGAQVVALGTDIAGRHGQRRRLPLPRGRRRRCGRRGCLADAAAGRAARQARHPHRRHRPQGRPRRRHAHRRALPQGVRRRGHPVGARRHRRPGLQRQGPQGSPPQGRHRLRRRHPAHPGGVLRRLTPAYARLIAKYPPGRGSQAPFEVGISQ